MYFDQAASNANHKPVLQKTFSIIQNLYANPSVSHQSGEKVKKVLDESLQIIASYLNVDADQIIITSGATEANNHLLKSLYEMNPQGHVILSPFEHSSILTTASYLQSKGMRLSFAPIDADGHIDAKALSDLIQEDTFLISIVYQESEMGILQNVDGLAKKVKEIKPDVLFHSDITQALGKMPLSLEHVDFLTFSGHKIGSMRGVGALVTPLNFKLPPLIHGGKSLHPSRSGTPIVEGLISMGIAFECIDETSHHISVQKLNCMLRNLLQNNDSIHINSPKSASPSILNISLLPLPQKVAQMRLKKKGFDVSIGSACANKQGSQAVYRLYHQAKLAQTSIRISLSPYHTPHDIRLLSQAIKEVLR